MPAAFPLHANAVLCCAVQVTCVAFNGHKMYTVGVGAARAFVVGQDMWLDPLTGLHLPSNEEEAERVEAHGGEIQRAQLEVGVAPPPPRTHTAAPMFPRVHVRVRTVCAGELLGR